MPYSGDPPEDTMQDRVEAKVRDLLLASSDLAALQVVYRGEPGWIPVYLYPFAVVFLQTELEATGQEGYGESTGMRYYRYDGYVSFEVLVPDAEELVPDSGRRADVPSYIEAKRITQAAFNAILSWGGPQGNLEQDPVTSYDGKEQTVELRTDTITNGLASRRDNVSNRGSFAFHVYTRRLDF